MKKHAPDFLVAAGTASVVAGVSQIHIPSACIVGGAILLGIGLAAVWAQAKQGSTE